jgi:hypothetical protein
MELAARFGTDKLDIGPMNYATLNAKPNGGLETTVAGLARVQDSLNSCESSFEPPSVFACGSPNPVRRRDLLAHSKRISPMRWCLACVLLWFSPAVWGQGYVDFSKPKSEHLITHGRGATGDVFIYISFPNWFSAHAGYCPVYVRVVPQKGLVFKSDGVLRFSVSPGPPYRESGSQSSVDIPIVQGTSEARGELLANNATTSYINFFATLNGRKLSGQRVYAYNQGFGGNGTISGRDLVIISSASSQADSHRWAALLEMKRTGKWFSQTEFNNGPNSLSSYADATQLPANWLYLSSLDQVSISADDLAVLSQDALKCLQNYVQAGGQLDVCKVNSISQVTQFLPFDSRHKLTDLTNRSVRDFESDTDYFQDTVWDRFIRDSSRSALYNTRSIMATNPSGRSQFPLISSPHLIDFAQHLSPHIVEVGQAYLDFRFANTEILASRLFESHAVPVSVGSSDNAAENLTAPQLISYGFGSVRLDPKSRRDTAGIALERNNLKFSITANRSERFKDGIGDDFWKWLIPAVGRTPVIPFLIFVVLFVGIVVPGLMFWCNKHKRRVWLVVSMPLTALFFTLMLFGYGIFKDGLGAISRTRSLAFVDNSGDGIVWSRQSYFAARVPAQGIVLEPDTQIVPLVVNSDGFQDCQLMYSDGKQQYVGLLPPRLQSQFSIAHPIKKLKLFRREQAIDPVLHASGIVNDSGFPWSTGIFVDAGGKAFLTSNVQIGQTAVFSESNLEDALSVLRKAFQSNPLQAPTDAPSADQISLNEFFGGLFSYNRYRPNSVDLIFEESIWESALGLNQAKMTAVNIPYGLQAAWPFPNTFVIFAEQAPYLEKCLVNVKEQDGLHTIIGSW